ncbi:MAG: hypothetical protein EXR69_14265 [Myxococcales bacterium]|nr:hypothetical protein [Myxococcales bacterium]
MSQGPLPSLTVAVRSEEPLARHLPLRCGGAIEQWVEVADEAELVAILKLARAEKWTVRPIPAFHDALPPEGGMVGLGLRFGGELEGVRAADGDPDGCLRVGAGAVLAPIGLRPGFEALRFAPGTLQDAYEEGWIQPALVRVRRVRGRGVEDSEDVKPDGKSLLVSAVLRPGRKLKPPSAGQAFVELQRAGPGLRAILGKAQLRGLRVHGATLGEIDPAVLSNRDDATPRQLRTLLGAVRERIQTSTGIQLEERLVPAGRGGRL